MMTLNKFKDTVETGKFNEPYEAINMIVNENWKVSDDFVRYIFDIEDEMLTIEFAEKFRNYDLSQLNLVQQIISKKLIDGADKLLLSCMIELASDLGLNSFFDRCFSFASNSKEDHLVVLSSVFYLYENHNSINIREVIRLFDKIINSREYYQNAQVAACFYLLRLTCHPKYVTTLRDYVQNADPLNRDVLQNILALDYNQQDYFYYHNELKSFLAS